MADFRPLVIDGTQIEELDGTNDRLMIRDLVSVVNSADSLRWNSNSFLVSIANNHRFVVDDDKFYFRTVGLNTTTVNIWSNSTTGDSVLNFGEINATGEDQCEFRYTNSSLGSSARKLSLAMIGKQSTLGSVKREVVGIQTNLITVDPFHNTSVVIPSRGNIAGNVGSELTQYYETGGICNFSEVASNTDAAAVQLGLGISLVKAGNNLNGPSVEFVKTRAASIADVSQSDFNAGAAPEDGDVLGQLIAGGTVGAGTSNPPMSGTIAFKASNDWSTTKRAAHVVFATQEYTTDTIIAPLTVGKEIGTSDSTGGKTIQLPIAPTASGSAYLRVDGSRNIVVFSSSRRYKKNIKDVTLKQCQNIVDNLRPVKFEFKGETIQQYGLIAEEVEQVDKVLATHNNDGEVESVNYESIAVMLLKVVKDQQKQITKLETRIAALEG